MTSPKSESAMTPRGAARLAAVQALYQMDLAGTGLDRVIDEFVSHRFGVYGSGETETADGADAAFFADLLRGVVRRQADIDPMIDKALAQGWRLTRIDSILRAVLRAGVFELLERPDVPARVVISEYVETARAFFEDDEPKVANAILDRLARTLRPREFEAKDPKA